MQTKNIVERIDNHTQLRADSMTQEDLVSMEWDICALEKLACESGIIDETLERAISIVYEAVVDGRLIDYVNKRGY